MNSREFLSKLSKTGAENLERWLGARHSAEYRGAIQQLVEEGKFERLDELFWQVLPFGTGGRRGPMAQFGPATINERTIAESAQGIADYLRRFKGEEGGRAVVAYDTRHRSAEFGQLTATTLAANGLDVFLFEDHRSTPELSFAVRYLKCDVGVMISASHNPPSDNGVKAYWSNGGQVLPPHDKGIIACVYAVTEIPQLDYQTALESGHVTLIGEEVDQAYWKAVWDMSLSDARSVKAIYSPLHGVGETACYEILKRAGFDEVEIFEPHRAPDGDFPNVPDHLPNPERPQVFKQLIERAKETGAELLLASDPDADRLGVTVRSADGEFVHLSGNRIGALLADYICRNRTDLTGDHFVVETLVTTPLIGRIARSHGLKVIDDLLVGFKYIGRTIDEYGPDKFVFGAEESLGYLAGTYARDKDAGIATLYMLECASELKREDKTLLDRLDELYVEHGYFLEDQMSKVCVGSQGSRQIAMLLGALRDHPPKQLAGLHFDEVRDYERHEIRALPANQKTADLPQPEGNLLFFTATAGTDRYRIAVRPSGTEPKIKFYLFAELPVADRDSLARVKARAAEKMTELETGLHGWLDGVLSA